jgi:hypothetical protein
MRRITLSLEALLERAIVGLQAGRHEQVLGLLKDVYGQVRLKPARGAMLVSEGEEAPPAPPEPVQRWETEGGAPGPDDPSQYRG